MSIFKKENGALVEYTNPLPADYVAPIEDGATSAHNYAVGAFALVKGVLRKITTAVTSGTAITNANSEITTVAEQLEEINTDLSEIGWTKVTSKSITDVPNTAKEIRIAIEVNFGAIGYFDMMMSDIPNIIGCCMTYYNSPSQWGYANISVTATTISVQSNGSSTYTLKDLYYR